MADISQRLEPPGCVTFIGESDEGKEWLLANCKESKPVFALNGIEKQKAERLLNQARQEGLEVSDPD
jgi:hypothetical protein